MGWWEDLTVRILQDADSASFLLRSFDPDRDSETVERNLQHIADVFFHAWYHPIDGAAKVAAHLLLSQVTDIADWLERANLAASRSAPDYYRESFPIVLVRDVDHITVIRIALLLLLDLPTQARQLFGDLAETCRRDFLVEQVRTTIDVYEFVRGPEPRGQLFKGDDDTTDVSERSETDKTLPPTPPDDETLAALRKAIADLGQDAKTTVIQKAASVNRQKALQGLRYLESLGEYRGYTRPVPRRYMQGSEGSSVPEPTD